MFVFFVLFCFNSQFYKHKEYLFYVEDKGFFPFLFFLLTIIYIFRNLTAMSLLNSDKCNDGVFSVLIVYSC